MPNQNCLIKRTTTHFRGLLVVVLMLLLVMVVITEAKHYNQPYGDIGQDEDETAFGSREEANRLDPKVKQRLGYSNNHQPSSSSRGRNPSEYTLPENNQYHFIDSNYYNRNNRNSAGHSYPKGWMVSSNFVEEPHYNMTEEINEDAAENKCNIWVPVDVLEKYPKAKQKQENKIAGSVYIEICCKGYAPMRWRGKTLCRPVCENCQNGRCIAPGVCECYDEYVANDNGDCVFTCPLGCLNGRCYLDGSCECDPGYKLDKSRKFCKPICSKGCGTSRLHNCTEPEVCGCIKGYVLTDNDCQPVCPYDCGIGGICRQPDTCECNPGFDLKDGVCQADCYQKCDNGVCLSRNRCICSPGFTYHERSTQCVPK